MAVFAETLFTSLTIDTCMEKEIKMLRCYIEVIVDYAIYSNQYHSIHDLKLAAKGQKCGIMHLLPYL